MALLRVYEESPTQIFSSFKFTIGNCLTSICTSSLNTAVHPALSVIEVIIIFPLKFGFSLIGTPSGINKPLVSMTNDFRIESCNDIV